MGKTYCAQQQTEKMSTRSYSNQEKEKVRLIRTDIKHSEVITEDGKGKKIVKPQSLFQHLLLIKNRFSSYKSS